MRSVKFGALVIALLVASPIHGYADNEEFKAGSVEWYRLPENKDALTAKLVECEQKSRSEQQNDDQCRHAKKADFLGTPYEKVKEPTYGF